jgi:LemA protein
VTFYATIAIAAAALLTGWGIVVFNRLVRHRNLVAEAWSGIDVQLKRRRNLVPNLVECVKHYMQHERTVLERVTALRAEGERTGSLRETADHENALTDQLKGLFALAEAYPDLKADRSFLTLQQQLVEIEDHIQMARRYFNGAVRDYNIRAESFPDLLVARALKFAPRDFFQIETATDRVAPRVALQDAVDARNHHP